MTNFNALDRHQLMSRQIICRKIKQNIIDYKIKVKCTLKDIKHVCTTADIWSAKHRSSFRVTAHWIVIKRKRL